MKIKNHLLKSYWIASAQFGIDPRKTIRSIIGLPRYIRDFLQFRKGFSGRLQFVPCLHDWYEEGGSAKSEYFWQDLYVARKIHEAKPQKHVDIGSRFDGFVAHIASFREIEVFDIRPITTSIPGVTVKQADLMNLDTNLTNYCDSLSCLHALEHFGLGRYGDPIDPQGYERGLRNMANILKPGGMFYLSVPVGAERVDFNANRVFDPQTILTVAEVNRLELQAFAIFDQANGLIEMDIREAIERIMQMHYVLGIFTFVRTA